MCGEVYIWPDGRKYEGDYADDHEDGRGVLTWPAGSFFKGTWAKGRWTEGEWRGFDKVFKGSFETKFLGEDTVFKFTPAGDDSSAEEEEETELPDHITTGMFFYQNGGYFNGQKMDGNRHGQGTHVYPNGDIFTGSFKQDKETGHGSLARLNREKYEGEFKDGLFHGSGTYTWPPLIPGPCLF